MNPFCFTNIGNTFHSSAARSFLLSRRSSPRRPLSPWPLSPPRSAPALGLGGGVRRRGQRAGLARAPRQGAGRARALQPPPQVARRAQLHREALRRLDRRLDPGFDRLLPTDVDIFTGIRRRRQRAAREEMSLNLEKYCNNTTDSCTRLYAALCVRVSAIGYFTKGRFFNHQIT